ncbi:hypothetical protein MBANPS3_011688 [Mucor bainieri]
MRYEDFAARTNLSKYKAWKSPEEVNKVLRDIEEQSFLTDRKSIRDDLNLISTKDYHYSFCNMVNEYYRFKDGQIIFDMSHPTYLEIFGKLYATLDVKNEKEPNRYDSASRMYRSTLATLKMAFLSGVGSYDRKSQLLQ